MVSPGCATATSATFSTSRADVATVAVVVSETGSPLLSVPVADASFTLSPPGAAVVTAVNRMISSSPGTRLSPRFQPSVCPATAGSAGGPLTVPPPGSVMIVLPATYAQLGGSVSDTLTLLTGAS